MRLKKLDGRHAGSTHFDYFIEYTYKDYQRYADQRAWCWTTWGPSVELQFYKKVQPTNPHWAWINDNYRLRVYLVGEHEASHYLLRWGDQ